jgi:hypothetical protein
MGPLARINALSEMFRFGILTTSSTDTYEDAAMPTPICPQCRNTILSEEVNVARDVAYCRKCNLSHSLSTLTHDGELEPATDMLNPPKGAWWTSSGAETVIGATHRSLGTAAGALAFGLFWNGIVSVFVLLAIAGTLHQLGLPVPHWFPAPNVNDSPMGLGMVIFLWIFLTPFITIGLIMIGTFLSALAGRTEVRSNHDEVVVFVGIGALGWRRRLPTSEIQEVLVNHQQWRDSDGDPRHKTCIVLETRQGKEVRFASMLNPERRKFMAAALRRALLRR